MNRIGIRGIVYEWFKDYLTNTRQYVTSNGLNSDINSIKCGVPQGCVLVPLLFVLYVNYIGNCVFLIHLLNSMQTILMHLCTIR